MIKCPLCGHFFLSLILYFRGIIESYYEVMIKQLDEEGNEVRVPVARFPIANTNMLIQN